MSAAPPLVRTAPRVPLALLGGLAATAALVAAGAAAGPRGVFPSLLAAALFGLGVALGAGVFLSTAALTGARWWLPLRGVASALAGTLPVPALLLAGTLAAGLGALYPWAHAGHGAHFGHAKAVWLSAPLFLARALAILVVWLGLVAYLRSRLAAWGAGTAPRSSFVRAAGLFVVVLAPTLSVGSWDWAMSLEPHWYSTMFGVYVFAGSFLSGLAALTVAAVLLERRGLLAEPLGASRTHDLGRLLFAFSTFWAYIWFCQYLLIWYANLPEEVPHFVARTRGEWATLFWLSPVLSFAVPFLALLTADAKKRSRVLLPVALVVLLGRWLDSWLLVAPAATEGPAISVTGLAAGGLVALAMTALFVRIHGGRWPAGAD